MNAVDRTPNPGFASTATASAIGWGIAVAGFSLSAAADAAWGWEGAASMVYGLAAIVLVVSGGLLVVTELGLRRLHGGLGPVAVLGIAVTAAGALLSFVAWAYFLWIAVLGVGTLLFGLPLLRRGVVPRRPALALTFALPAAALVLWAGAVLFDAAGDDASPLAEGLVTGLVGVGLLVLAAGLVGIGRWMQAGGQVSPATS